MTEPDNLTVLLNRARSGDGGAAGHAFSAIYGQLKQMAQAALNRDRNDWLTPTALVHEAYLRLIPDQAGELAHRAHFFRLAARAMRQILVDQARRQHADKRGGDWVRTELTARFGIANDRELDLLAIDQALTQLERSDARAAEVVESYFFAGQTFEEIAAVLGTSDRSVRREWDFARAFLLRALAGQP